MNGEHPKAIKTRKIIFQNQSSVIELIKEIVFINAVALKFKKSSAIWHYRLQIFTYLLKNSKSDDLDIIWREECSLL